MKRVLVVLVVLVAVVAAATGLGYFFLNRYLNSGGASQQVASTIGAYYGGDVEVGDVDVGIGGSSIKDFKLFEQKKPQPAGEQPQAAPAASPKERTPWLAIKALRTDINLWSLVRGLAVPKQVTLEEPVILLRFDEQGNLLTRIPFLGVGTEEVKAPTGGVEDLVDDSAGLEGYDLSVVPEVEIQGGTIIFRRQGQPDLVAKNVDARLARDGKVMALRGSAQSADLGKLLLDGSYQTESNRLAVSLKTEAPARVTRELLHRVPFVPQAVWRELDVEEGVTPAELTLKYDLGNRDFHYRVDLEPKETKLRVTAIELPVQGAHGKVVVEDNVVRLADVQGKAFRGEARLDGVLDFSDDVVSRLQFTDVTVNRADVTTFPPSWKFPASRIKGNLTGKADIQITYRTEPMSPASVGGLVGAAGAPGHFRLLRTAAAMAAVAPKTGTNFTGQGTGRLEDATVLGFPAAEPPKIDWTPATGFAVDEAKTSDLGNPPGPLAQFREGEAPAEPVGPHDTGNDRSRPVAPARQEPRPPEGGRDVDLVGALLTGNTALVLQQPEEAPAVNQALADFLRESLRGIRTASRGIVETGRDLFQAIPEKIDTTKPADGKPSYLTVNLRLKDVNLGDLIKRLEIKVPVAVDGKLSFQVKASFPINDPGDLKGYKFTGTAQLKDLRVDAVRLPEADAEVVYDLGVLTLKSLKGSFAEKGAPGTFQGTARLQAVPLGDLTADLKLDRIPLDQLAGLADGKLPVAGTVSGDLTARVAVSQLKDPKAWAGAGTLRSDRLVAAGLAFDGAEAVVRLEGGVFRVNRLQADLQGSPITALGSVRLAEAGYPYQADLFVKQWDLAALGKLSPDFRLPVALAGVFTTSVNVAGTLQPFAVKAGGDASATGLRVEKYQIQDAKFRWDATGEQVTLRDLSAQLYGGVVTGSAVLPLEAKLAGAIDLKVKGLDARELGKDLPIPFKVEGNVDGVVKATLPPAEPGGERAAKFNLNLTAPKLRVQNIPTEQLQGSLDYQKGLVDYKLEGKSLGGTFELEGQVPAAAEPAAKPAREGKLSLRNLQLARLFEALRPGGVGALAGRLSLEMAFRHDAVDGLPDGEGVLRITGLRWGRDVLANNLQGGVRLDGGVLRLAELSGSLGQGTFRTNLAYNFRSPERSFFNVTLNSVDAGKLLAPWLDDNVTGVLDARIRGTLGATLTGSADVTVSRGTVYGLDVAAWTLPIRWSYAPAQGRGQVQIASTSATVARGRATGRLNAYWDYTARVDGELRFFGVDVQQLARQVSGPTQALGGQMTGRFDFEGSGMRSLDDLTGTLEASFRQAQALQLPVLRQAAPFLGVGPSTTFQSGSLRARLARGGSIRVQDLNLEGGVVQVHADGTANTAGRLNLNVVARTGDVVGIPFERLRLLGLAIPAAGPVPLVVLQEASALFSNRLIYLSVTGTVRNPNVRPLPAPILTDAAARYFLGRTLPFNPLVP